jgi:hypothetical protein
VLSDLKDKLLGYCKQCVKDYQILHKRERKIYLEKNKQKFINYRKNHYQMNIEKIKQYYQEHKAEIIYRCRKYYEINKTKIINRIRIYAIKKRKYNINFKLRCYLGSRICHALKGICKSKTTIELLGCSIEFLKRYLKSKFKLGMTWKNYGKWEVDHIKPCCSFNLSKVSEQRKCFHYTNLQPLWKKENRCKQGKI